MMLMQFDYLKTPLGGIIAVAAMVDDVASLVILAVLEELQDTTGTSSSVDWACILLAWALILIVLCIDSCADVLNQVSAESRYPLVAKLIYLFIILMPGGGWSPW